MGRGLAGTSAGGGHRGHRRSGWAERSIAVGAPGLLEGARGPASYDVQLLSRSGGAPAGIGIGGPEVRRSSASAAFARLARTA